MRNNQVFFIYFVFVVYFSCEATVPQSSETITPTIKMVTTSESDSIPIGLQKILKAYPEHFKGATRNSLIWADGTEMQYDDGVANKSFRTLLDSADIEDQFVFAYLKGKEFARPIQRNYDPGRLRNEPFYYKMYGSSKEEVQKKLTTIIWMPKVFKVKLLVTTVNGIDKKMQALSAELETKPHLYQYLENPGGTFNWRKIAGTNRISAHAFGSTIDINVEYSNYWRWAVKDAVEDSPREIVYKNQIPLELVEIFEKYGFIWGGKWYHYDTMHFEYRPELLID